MNLLRIFVHPRRTCRDILRQETLNSSLAIVLGFGIAVSLLFLRSHLAHDYPPPPEQMETWIEAWGEFAMLPYVNIPAERYRLAQAIFVLPLSIAIWILMAGSARVLSVLFSGRTTFVQYANLFGHTFYAFWALATILDGLYTLILGDHILRALRTAYGPVARTLASNYPPMMWTVMLGLGAAYKGIAAYQSEGVRGATGVLRAMAIAVVTGFWPIVLITLLLR